MSFLPVLLIVPPRFFLCVSFFPAPLSSVLFVLWDCCDGFFISVLASSLSSYSKPNLSSIIIVVSKTLMSLLAQDDSPLLLTWLIPNSKPYTKSFKNWTQHNTTFCFRSHFYQHRIIHLPTAICIYVLPSLSFFTSVVQSAWDDFPAPFSLTWYTLTSLSYPNSSITFTVISFLIPLYP